MIAVASPHLLAYRNKSRVAASIATAAGIRSALASYAADIPGNHYPMTGDISDWGTLRTIVNTNGGMLKTTADAMDIAAIRYRCDDGETYILQIIVDVPRGMPGRTISITPASITRD